MSQRVNPILFNNFVYNNSFWFRKKNAKFSLNEDLQIREIISIIFNNNYGFQYFFIDNIVIYKYFSKIKIYVYFFCNLKYLRRNLYKNKNILNHLDKKYLDVIFLYYKYYEYLNIKKIEVLKLLYNLKYNKNNVYLYFKNINPVFNNFLKLLKRDCYYYTVLNRVLNRNKSYRYCRRRQLKSVKSQKVKENSLKLWHRYIDLRIYRLKLYNKVYYARINKQKFTKKEIFGKVGYQKKGTYNLLVLTKELRRLNYFNRKLKSFSVLNFILYHLCFNYRFLNKVTASSLLKVIYYELNSIDNNSKNFNFLFYNIFNSIRSILDLYMKQKNCNLRGLTIVVKGRYFITKRKRIFIFNVGELNLNRIDIIKDYSSLNLTTLTGACSIKIWLNYKN